MVLKKVLCMDSLSRLGLIVPGVKSSVLKIGILFISASDLFLLNRLGALGHSKDDRYRTKVIGL